MRRYLLELSESERATLFRTVKKHVPAARDQDTIEMLRDELAALPPCTGMLIELPAGMSADGIKITTSLQIPFEVYVAQRDGNRTMHSVISQLHDPDRIGAIAATIGIIQTLTPLLASLNRFHETLIEACEGDIVSASNVQEAMNVFRNDFEAAYTQVSGLAEAR